MFLPVTSLYAGLLALLLIVLSVRIIRERWIHRVGIGTGEAKSLEIAVRVHGNFVEFVPFCLILLALMELAGASPQLLHGLGGLLFVARISHAIGLTKSAGTSIYRTIGVAGTFAVLLLQSGFLIGAVIGH
ncbi:MULTISPECIES: MAPEG family protein [Gammaproteobacteria]|uniref:MAPEG family protein n=1 Tax=Gammaproteobacteria TaxID=1236 RepID=UPI000DD04D08|nr:MULTISPECIES: MAPEG family protein [Gammaproteobacteria]RTE87626.1 glutathione S-transferase [Aliidiomarina sp. B3213]TCZ92589.1 glutathione S-transferase [Lysobacter sp. N42]